MNSKKATFAALILLAALLTACGSQTTQTSASASQPTKVAPTDTAVSATDTSVPAATETTGATEPAASASVSFANDIMPILESRCLNCHGGDRLEEGLSVRTYADLMSGSENGPVIVAGDAANSKLVELVQNQKMPKRGPKLTPPQVQLIIDWVNQGALDN